MAWVTVETNEGLVVLRVNTILYGPAGYYDMEDFEHQVTEAVSVAQRIEEPLESLENDE